jgi:hypothetical protein
VRIGVHTSDADVSTFPVTLVPIENLGDGAAFLPRQRTPIEFDAAASDGRGFAHRWGGKDIAAVPVEMEFKGVNSNTGAAVADWEAKLEQGLMLQSIFGAVAPATTNTATTCSGTAAATLTVVSGTDIPNNTIIAFTTTTGFFIRRVISGGGTTTLTLDRAASGTASGTVFRLARYTIDTTRAAFRHLGIDCEGTTASGTAWRQRFIGCGPQGCEIVFPETGLVQFKSTWMPTDFDQPAAASPAFASPTAGAPIASNGLTFNDNAIGDLDIAQAVLKIDNGLVMRPTASGPNGVRGGVATNKRTITLEGLVYMGGAAPAQQLNLANTQAWLGSLLSAGTVATTRQLALQVGGAVGACMSVFMPAASVSATVVNQGGLQAVKFRAVATGLSPLILGVG